MTELQQKVKVMALGLQPGASSNGNTCPVCLGGSNKDKAFSVTREFNGNLKYICFRASCGVRGRVTSSTSTQAVEDYFRQPEIPPLRPLDNVEIGRYRSVYKNVSTGFIQRLRVGVHSTLKDGIYYPIHNLRRGVVGWHFKVDPRFGGVKTSNIILFSDVGRGDWYYTYRGGDFVIVVEDQVSADTINYVCGVSTYALNGSSISQQEIITLKYLGFDKIYLSLDTDAKSKTLSLANKYTLLGVEAITWDSLLDPKELPDEDLFRLFKDGK